jgi:large subunit ribosomal protein L29
MKTSEIREMTLQEIAQKAEEAKQELFNLRFQHATGQKENPMRMKELKKNIARLLTIQKEMQPR